MLKKLSRDGFSAIEVIVILVVVAVIGLGGWYIWHTNHNKTIGNTKVSTHQANSSSQKTNAKSVDKYAGWKTATSTRAGFSIKYPTDWTYNEVVGSNDNVEHITIDSSHFQTKIDSYSGKDVANGGQPATTCTDCVQTINSTSFTATKIGSLDLKTITYKLDNGQGNALILTLPDSTYYLPSPVSANIYTSFRGISSLDSEQAYQSESSSQFMANPDYKTAQNILESVAY